MLKMNEQVVHQFTLCLLTAHYLKNEKYLWRDFDKKIEEKLGPEATFKYFDDMEMEETPMFEIYRNNYFVEGTTDEPPKELEPTPDLSTDVRLNASIVVP